MKYINDGYKCNKHLYIYVVEFRCTASAILISTIGVHAELKNATCVYRPDMEFTPRRLHHLKNHWKLCVVTSLPHILSLRQFGYT